MAETISTPEQQAKADSQAAADARVRSLDSSNVNLQSGTGKVPVKATATTDEIEHAKTVTGAGVVVGPLAEQDPEAAQVDLVADAQKAADEARSSLPRDHQTPESPKPTGGPPKSGGASK